MNSMAGITNLYYNPVNPVPLQFQQRELKRQEEMEPTEVFEKLLYKECEKNSRIIGTPRKPVEGTFNQFAFQRAGRTLAFVNQGERWNFSVRDSEEPVTPFGAEQFNEMRAPDANMGACSGVEEKPQYSAPQPMHQGAGRIESTKSVSGF